MWSKRDNSKKGGEQKKTVIKSNSLTYWLVNFFCLQV